MMDEMSGEKSVAYCLMSQIGSVSRLQCFEGDAFISFRISSGDVVIKASRVGTFTELPSAIIAGWRV